MIPKQHNHNLVAHKNFVIFNVPNENEYISTTAFRFAVNYVEPALYIAAMYENYFHKIDPIHSLYNRSGRYASKLTDHFSHPWHEGAHHVVNRFFSMPIADFLRYYDIDITELEHLRLSGEGGPSKYAGLLEGRYDIPVRGCKDIVYLK